MQNAQHTVALALAPSSSEEDFEIFCARILAEADERDCLIRDLPNSTAAMADRAKNRAEATSRILQQVFTASGCSVWNVR